MRLLLVLAACALAGCAAPLATPDAGSGADVTFPALRFETELGAFTAILYEEDHPASVDLYRRLVGAGYYDGRAFGRVIPTFVIQEVDRTGGTTDSPERAPLEAGTRAHFSAGAIGIARDAAPDSGGPEFFVMDHAISTLYGNYTTFAQVVEGLDVVHAIARVDAVENPAPLSTPSGLPVYAGVHDRMPVDPVQMTRVSLVEVTMPAAEAARFPLVVGPTFVTDTLRASLEWPADLRAGAEARLTWYVAPRGEATLPPLEGAEVRVRGPAGETALPVAWDAAYAGIGAWSWTPAASGEHVATLWAGGREVARVPIAVS